MKFKIYNYHNESNVVEIAASTRMPWVRYGEDNLFPQKLRDLADNSSIHSGLIIQKQKFIAGDGVEIVGSESGLSWLDDITGGLDELLSRTAADISLIDGFSWETIYQRDGRIAQLLHKDISRIRSGKMIDGVVSDYYFASDWKKTNRSATRYKPTTLKAFDFNRGRRDGKQLIYIFGYKQGKDLYPEPEYLGALNYIKIAQSIAEFHQSNLDNGFAASVHIHAFGQFDEEDEVELERNLNKKFCGKDKAGKLVLTTGSQEEGVPKITEMPTLNNTEILAQLEKTVNQEIIAAHRIPLSLSGLPFATGLQSEGLAIESALQMFQNTVIRSKQMMIERALNKVLSLNGFDTQIKIKHLSPFDANQSDAIKLATRTINELREEGGKEPLTDGDTFAKQTKNGNV